MQEVTQREATHPEVSEAPLRYCGVSATVGVIGGRWKPQILWSLVAATRRFSELERFLPGASPKVLTEQLRALEEDGLIARTVFPEVPPRVEYALTERGRGLVPLLQAMEDWGLANRDTNASVAYHASELKAAPPTA